MFALVLARLLLSVHGIGLATLLLVVVKEALLERLLHGLIDDAIDLLLLSAVAHDPRSVFHSLPVHVALPLSLPLLVISLFLNNIRFVRAKFTKNRMIIINCHALSVPNDLPYFAYFASRPGYCFG